MLERHQAIGHEIVCAVKEAVIPAERLMLPCDHHPSL